MPSSWKDLLKEVNVRPLQERLKELGYSIADNEVARNVIGDSTKEAIRQIQRRVGLELTGKFDEATAEALDHEQSPVAGTRATSSAAGSCSPMARRSSACRSASLTNNVVATPSIWVMTPRMPRAHSPFEQLRPQGKLAADQIFRAFDRSQLYGSDGKKSLQENGLPHC